MAKFAIDWLDDTTMIGYCVPKDVDNFSISNTPCLQAYIRGDGVERPTPITDTRIYCVGCGKLLGVGGPA